MEFQVIPTDNATDGECKWKVRREDGEVLETHALKLNAIFGATEYAEDGDTIAIGETG